MLRGSYVYHMNYLSQLEAIPTSQEKQAQIRDKCLVDIRCNTKAKCTKQRYDQTESPQIRVPTMPTLEHKLKSMLELVNPNLNNRRHSLRMSENMYRTYVSRIHPLTSAGNY